MHFGERAVSALVVFVAKQVFLLREKRVLRVELQLEHVFVSVVVQIDEPVVQQKSSVALPAVAVIYLVPTCYVLKRFNDKAVAPVVVRPARHSRPLVIQHVRVSDKGICFVSLYLYAKNSGGHHHAHLRVLFQRKLSVVGHLLANQRVVCLNVFDFVGNLAL